MGRFHFVFPFVCFTALSKSYSLLLGSVAFTGLISKLGGNPLGFWGRVPFIRAIYHAFAGWGYGMRMA
jgi:hypothetical protein